MRGDAMGDTPLHAALRTALRLAAAAWADAPLQTLPDTGLAHWHVRLDGTGLQSIAAVLVLPYALLRWGTGREAALGLVVLLLWLPVTLIAVPTTPAEKVGGYGLFLFSAALGARKPLAKVPRRANWREGVHFTPTFGVQERPTSVKSSKRSAPVTSTPGSTGASASPYSANTLRAPR